MKPSRIEAWALDVIERVEANQPNEDSRVELKAEWPADKQRAARRLAGHANAARGEPILWLIGVDQGKGVTGATMEDLADWFPGVKAEFEGLAPTLVDVNVPWKGLTVVALLFQTDRAPFVVKNPVAGKQGSGPVELEVPWRDGTRVRTARRDELLRLLVPLQLLPTFEVLNGRLCVRTNLRTDDPSRNYLWELALDVYVTPRQEGRLTIPFHQCAGSVVINSAAPSRLPFDEVQLRPPYLRQLPGPGGSSEPKKLSLTIDSTPREVHINGPGSLVLVASAATTEPPEDAVPEVRAELNLLPVGAETRASIEVTLRAAQAGMDERAVAVWQLNKHIREWACDYHLW